MCIGCTKGAFAFEGNYPVYFGKQAVGKVQVLRQGLYYRCCCRCQCCCRILCRLVVRWGEGTESLGIVVPMDQGFGLDTRLPVKRFGLGEPEFILTPKLEKALQFHPIYPDEPFAYIARLKEGYLTYKEGQAGIVLEG